MPLPNRERLSVGNDKATDTVLWNNKATYTVLSKSTVTAIFAQVVAKKLFFPSIYLRLSN